MSEDNVGQPYLRQFGGGCLSWLKPKNNTSVLEGEGPSSAPQSGCMQSPSY